MSKAIIILGMHRSGTSCLTGCLKHFGLNFGNVSNKDKYNQKGNQENRDVSRFNESVLNFNQGSWQSPPDTKLNINESLKNKLNQLVLEYKKLSTPWGLKDPRMLLTYEIWKDVLPKHSFIGTYRHPLAVADSLYSRENFPVDINKGLKLWEIYNSKLLELYDKNTFQIINFDLSDKDYITELMNISTFFGLGFDKETIFFDSNLRKQNNYTYEECPDNLKPMYDRLLEISQC